MCADKENGFVDMGEHEAEGGAGVVHGVSAVGNNKGIIRVMCFCRFLGDEVPVGEAHILREHVADEFGVNIGNGLDSRKHGKDVFGCEAGDDAAGLVADFGCEGSARVEDEDFFEVGLFGDGVGRA